MTKLAIRHWCRGCDKQYVHTEAYNKHQARCIIRNRNKFRLKRITTNYAFVGRLTATLKGRTLLHQEYLYYNPKGRLVRFQYYDWKVFGLPTGYWKED